MNPCWPTVNQRICDIYGLNPDEVYEVRITLNANSIPAVAVHLKSNEGLAWVMLDVLEGRVFT